MKLQYTPSGELVALAEPPGSTATASFGAPPADWSTLVLDVADNVIDVTFGTTKKRINMASASSFGKAIGCILTVGAVATNNVPRITAHVARACVQPR